MSNAAAGKTTSEFGLSSEELQFYEENGYVGPFTAFEPEEFAKLLPIIEQATDRPSRTYGYKTGRDHHLGCRTLYDVCSHPAIIDRMASILGPNLLLWRTNLFRKPAGSGRPVAWHQGNDFPGARGIPAISPPNNVTAWFAFTHATKANGCMQLVPKTHHELLKVKKVPKGEGIFNRGFVLENLNADTAVHMVLKPGQFFLFKELTVHGSDPNYDTTDRNGVAVRVTTPATKVYAGQKVCGQGMQLKDWHAILVSGEDTHGHNRLGPPPEHDLYERSKVGKLAGRVRYFWQRKRYGYVGSGF